MVRRVSHGALAFNRRAVVENQLIVTHNVLCLETRPIPDAPLLEPIPIAVRDCAPRDISAQMNTLQRVIALR